MNSLGQELDKFLNKLVKEQNKIQKRLDSVERQLSMTVAVPPTHFGNSYISNANKTALPRNSVPKFGQNRTFPNIGQQRHSDRGSKRSVNRKQRTCGMKEQLEALKEQQQQQQQQAPVGKISTDAQWTRRGSGVFT